MSDWIKWLLITTLAVSAVYWIDRVSITSAGEELLSKTRAELSFYKDRAARLEAELASARLHCKPEQR